jgi:formylglycine-generating enzyme required for sulfatase activity
MFGRSSSLFLIALISLACSTSPPPEKPRTQAPPAPPARRTLDPAVVAKIESELVAIPGGRTIAPFRLARHEVTRGEWSAVMGQSPPDAEEADLPVAEINWNDAKELIRTLNEAKGAPVFRLPTAAEWEWGCRAGDMGPVRIQATAAALSRHAWWGENSGDRPHPVATKAPNAWGLYDMLGNVAEWCEDAREGNVDLRVNAGGNFVENLVGQNCSTTAWLAATGTESYTGFRLAANALSGQPAAHRPPIKKRKKS